MSEQVEDMTASAQWLSETAQALHELINQFKLTSGEGAVERAYSDAQWSQNFRENSETQDVHQDKQEVVSKIPTDQHRRSEKESCAEMAIR